MGRRGGEEREGGWREGEGKGGREGAEGRSKGKKVKDREEKTVREYILIA